MINILVQASLTFLHKHDRHFYTNMITKFVPRGWGGGQESFRPTVGHFNQLFVHFD